jgi:hypothetical protein
MVAASEYNLWTQAKIPLALGALHNFICVHDPANEAKTAYDYLAGSGQVNYGANINPKHLQLVLISHKWKKIRPV